MNVLQEKSQEVSQRNRQNNLKTLMKIMNTIEIDILLHELKLAIGNHIFHFYMGGISLQHLYLPTTRNHSSYFQSIEI